MVAHTSKLFIDYLPNQHATTAIGAYPPRARPGFPIAAPVIWRDIEHGLRSDAFNLPKLPRRAHR